ncbi:MAG: hypothetical protein ABJB01_07460 [Rudaea sp.]
MRLSRTLSIALSFFILSAALVGCDRQLTHYDAYRGDGTFVGHAEPALCRDGYTVDLGAIDLSVPGQIERRLDGLPPIESTLGVAIASKTSANTNELPRPSARVTITLRDEKQHIVLSRSERLSDWIRQIPMGDAQHAYLYQRGSLIDVPTGPDSGRVERFPLGQDDSWGTYFTPRRGARYTVHFAVDEPDADAAVIDARLEVRGVVGCL